MTVQPLRYPSPDHGRHKSVVSTDEDDATGILRQDRHRRDLAVVVIVGLAVLVFGAAFDAAEALGEIFAASEAIELDEIILSLATVGLLGFWYAARRWSDQKAQVARLQELRRSLIQSNIELTRANNAKSVFLAQMSHELRTPLNAVIGFSDALQVELYGPLNDKQADSVRMIGDSGRILLALVSDILDVSQIEAGEIELAPEPTSLRALVQQCVNAVEDEARGNDTSILFETDGSHPHVSVDRTRTRQALVSVLTNAIRYGRSDQPIRVRVATKLSPDAAVVEVIDRGSGMTVEQLVEATKPFVAFTGRDLPDAGSAGLGLSIAAGLAELQGGRLNLESRPGSGTTARLFLPLISEAEAEAAGARVIALAT